jgi:hypothetical protein
MTGGLKRFPPNQRVRDDSRQESAYLGTGCFVKIQLSRLIELRQALPRSVWLHSHLLEATGFQGDRHTRMKSAAKDPNEQSDMMVNAPNSWIQKSLHSIFKATDSKDGAVMGWICWGFKGYEDPNSSTTKQEKLARNAEPREPQKPDLNISNPCIPLNNSSQFTNVTMNR